MVHLNKIAGLAGNACFWLAFLALVIGLLEWLLQFAGISIVARVYSAGRLLELSAALLVFVIAVNTREILAELRSGSA